LYEVKPEEIPFTVFAGLLRPRHRGGDLTHVACANTRQVFFIVFAVERTSDGPMARIEVEFEDVVDERDAF
jgi:hypothetical protein